MKTSVLRTALLLVSSSAAFCQSANQANGEQIVKRAWVQASQKMYDSWMEKGLTRLGDASSVELTKILGAKNLEAQDIDAILLIINLSFRAPRLVEVQVDRQPRTTLFVLQSLYSSTNGPELKRKITDTKKYVQEQFDKSGKTE